MSTERDRMVAYRNYRDEQGNPAGGDAVGIGLEIHWQNGPRRKDGQAEMDAPNGAFVEDLIALCVSRIEFYQDSPYRCRENALAITKLEEALMWLEKRRQERRARGVEGMNQV